MISRIMATSSQNYGGKQVIVECDITNGLPGIHIVGMAHKSVDEAKERVRSALTNSGLVVPRKRITLNLSPAQLVKEGSGYDLAMAVAILVSSKQLPASSVKDTAFIGELALDGQIQQVPGIIGHLVQSASCGAETAFVPTDNQEQAALIEGVSALPVNSLYDLYKHLVGELPLRAAVRKDVSNTPPDNSLLSQVVGQSLAKKALMIAAAGQHNVLLTGPPGTGKSMLAKGLRSLLPPLSDQEMIEVTHVHSLVASSTNKVIKNRPFRSPHHSSSHVALVGGGTHPAPGEVTMAHCGVLFLDEFPEFARQTIEALRQPLEDREITVSRSSNTCTFPANCILVATQNPCPCGWLGSSKKECICTPQQISNYSKKLSGPVMDRIDIVVSVQPIDNSQLLSQNRSGWDQDLALSQIKNARVIQEKRFKSSTKQNSHMSNSDIKKLVSLSDNAKSLLLKAEKQLNLSARSYLKTIKVAQTIADLDQSPIITSRHMAESLQFRLR